MALIEGITIILHEKTEIGKDAFDAPIYEERAVKVPNVLVSPANTTDIIEQQGFNGKKEICTLAIPKGDTHRWEDAKIEFLGKMWKTFGFPTEGIDELIPLDWNKKVMVERYG